MVKLKSTINHPIRFSCEEILQELTKHANLGWVTHSQSKFGKTARWIANDVKRELMNHKY